MEKPCSKGFLLKVALLQFDWKSVGRRLLEKEQDVTDIDNEEKTEQHKREKVLMKWKEQQGSDATCQKLIEVLTVLGNKDTAEKVSAMLDEEHSKDTATHECKPHNCVCGDGAEMPLLMDCVEHDGSDISRYQKPIGTFEKTGTEDVAVSGNTSGIMEQSYGDGIVEATMRKCYPVLKNSINADDITLKLFQANLISKADWLEIENTQSRKKNSALLMALDRSVNRDERKFIQIFLPILQSDKAYVLLVDQIISTLKEEQENLKLQRAQQASKNILQEVKYNECKPNGTSFEDGIEQQKRKPVMECKEHQGSDVSSMHDNSQFYF